METDDRKDFRGHSACCEHDGVSAILQSCSGMELLYGGEDAGFSSLRAKDAQSAILNLEHGGTVTRWGRLVFHVKNVDALWTHLSERGFDPEVPQDTSWGERYFHMLDPDGHQLSFARPLQ